MGRTYGHSRSGQGKTKSPFDWGSRHDCPFSLYDVDVLAVDLKCRLDYYFYVEKKQGNDRREHARAFLRASAVLLGGGNSLGNFRVINASVGGLLLGGTPPGPVGSQVELVLRLGPDRTVRTQAVVCREQQSKDGTAFAVSFVNLQTEGRQQVQAAVDAFLEKVRSASVLVVDDSREVGHALGLELARMGQTVHAVQTPLEAVCMMEERNQVSVAIVDLVLGNAHGLDLITYLADRHPRVRRVLMSGNAHPAQLALSRHAAARSAPHDILAKPWTNRSLARAVGI
jgi:CheY-like chemotaxis protein